MLLKNKLQDLLAFSGHNIFHNANDGIGRITLLSEGDIDKIKSLVAEFENAQAQGKTLRNGGGALKREIEKLEYFREGYNEHLSSIIEILNPPERNGRKTLQDAITATQAQAVANLSGQYRNLPEKALRSLAEALMGDAQLDFFAEELPQVLAQFQILGNVKEGE